MSTASATADATPGAIGLQILSITPAPTEDERAAIIAAMETLEAELWPQPNRAAAPEPSPRWRYASRPWRRRQSYGGWS